jgi:hypothetical protein
MSQRQLIRVPPWLESDLGPCVTAFYHGAGLGSPDLREQRATRRRAALAVSTGSADACAAF